MTVAAAGTGKMGPGLARLLAGKGVGVAIGGRHPAKAAELAQAIGGGAQGGVAAAAAKLADLAGKALIDIPDPVTEDSKGLTTGHTTSAAEEIRKPAPRADVVEAHNTIVAEPLPAEAREGPAPVQVFAAGDGAAAKEPVSGVAAKGGFEPLDSGPLSNPRFLEPPGEINVRSGFVLGRGTSAAPAWVKAA